MEEDPNIADDEPLTAEEAQQASMLVDPDKPGASEYKWDQDFQREILSLILNDRTFTLESSALVKPSYFSDEIHRMLCDIAFSHFKQYKNPANKTQLVHEIRERISKKTDEAKARYYSELNTVLEYYNPGIENRDYYREKIVHFAKGMALKEAIRIVFEEIKKAPDSRETWTKIEEIVKKAFLVDQNFDLGLDYFNTAEERYERKHQVESTGDIFVTGFESIDVAFKNKGLLRGEMGSWMGLSGTGKSLALVAAALANLHRGKKVLYVSLEINQDAVADRFDAQIADPEKKFGITTSNLYEKKEIVFNALKEYVKDKEDSRLMVVKQFAPASLDVPMLRAYFSQLRLQGFVPDLVIIDYIGEMKDYPGVKTHESRYMIVRDLRGFAVEEKICVLTAMQPNKSGKEVVRSGMLMDEENLGDSYSQIKPLDAFWSINQLQDEKECGLARVYVAKTREGRSRFGFHIRFDYDNLSMKEISTGTYDSIYKKHKAEKDETIMDRNRHELEKRRASDIVSKSDKSKETRTKKPKSDTPVLDNVGDVFKNDVANTNEPLAPDEDMTPELE